MHVAHVPKEIVLKNSRIAQTEWHRGELFHNLGHFFVLWLYSKTHLAIRLGKKENTFLSTSST